MKTIRAACASGVALAALAAASTGPVLAEDGMEARIEALAPDLEAYVARGMEMFGTPGVAVGIVAGDRLVYARGFGTGREGGDPVGSDSVFQIGSTTKAFLAATIAIAVDEGRLAWDDRVVDLYPDFQLMDPWVTREFRVDDLLAQRSGLPPAVNDAVGMLGFDQDAMIRSLRYVEPASSFRNTFTYTNLTHILAGRIVADRMGAENWEALVTSEILGPLGMGDTSLTAAAIEQAARGTIGHIWTAEGPIEVPFTPIFPYGFEGAGAINSTVDDMSEWLRLLLADGKFAGQQVVSAENLAVVRMPRVAITDRASYAMGWVLKSTPNGQVTWHNGGTPSYGAFVGTLLDRDVGIVVLTNMTNTGMPDAIGEWALDRLLGNPEVDYLGVAHERIENASATAKASFTAPADPLPAPPLAGLTGSFFNPNFGDLEVTADGDALRAEIKETGAVIRLAPWNGSSFVANLEPDGRFEGIAANLAPFPLGFALFRQGPDGAAESLQLALAEGQPYDFTRK